MIWHSTDSKDVLKYYGVDENTGLTAEQVKNAELIENGDTQKPIALLLKLAGRQFNNVFYILMLIGAVISAVISLSSGSRAWVSTLCILLVIFIDSAYNIYQRYLCFRAKHETQSKSVTDITVIRDGIQSVIKSDRLVNGDIILLKSGDYIPVDARLITANGFRCDEYALTEETVDVEKDADFIADDIAFIKDRRNMAFCGCTVTHGTATAVVTDTGEDTEIAREEYLADNERFRVNLSKEQIASIIKYSTIVASLAALLVFILYITFDYGQAAHGFAGTVVSSFVSAMALIIAAVPETLPVAVLVVLWLTVKLLAKDGIFVNKFSSLENTAGISVICADKTGVLTCDSFVVQKIYDGEAVINVDTETASKSAVTLMKLALITSISTDYTDNAAAVVQDSSDLAISEFCSEHSGIKLDDYKNMYPVISSIPFDEQRKRVSAISMISGSTFLIVKGAPESIIDLCDNVNKDEILKIYEDLANEALRVIAVAYRPLAEIPPMATAEELECNLTFAGFIGLKDVFDKSIIFSAEECKKAGIRTIMITGDGLATAKAVARRIGILPDNMQAILGSEIAAMSDEELDRSVNSYSVFARVLPQDKYRIVKALKHNNEIVAVTGNKNSDAPVLRKANLGIANLKTATDVVKQTADISVEDTGIVNILNIIKRAKTVFYSIKKITHYFLSCNSGELLTVLLGAVIFACPPIVATQLLLVNLLTDILPTLALGKIPIDSSILYDRQSDYQKLFTRKTVISTSLQALALAVIAIISFSFGKPFGIETAQTMVFATLALGEVLHILSMYSDKVLIESNIFKHKLILITAAVCITAIALVLFTGIGGLFGLVILTPSLAITAIMLSVIFFAIDELIKIGFIFYEKNRRK